MILSEQEIIRRESLEKQRRDKNQALLEEEKERNINKVILKSEKGDAAGTRIIGIAVDTPLKTPLKLREDAIAISTTTAKKKSLDVIGITSNVKMWSFYIQLGIFIAILALLGVIILYG